MLCAVYPAMFYFATPLTPYLRNKSYEKYNGTKRSTIHTHVTRGPRSLSFTSSCHAWCSGSAPSADLCFFLLNTNRDGGSGIQ